MSNLHSQRSPKKVSYRRRSHEAQKAHKRRVKARQAAYAKYRSRIGNRITFVIAAVAVMAMAGGFVAMVTLLADDNQSDSDFGDNDNGTSFSMMRVCPEGSIRSGDLDDRLRPINEIPVKPESPYEDSESPERKARDRCVPLHEVVTIVSERLPALHASIDAYNAEVDASVAQEREALNGILGSGTAYEQVSKLLVAACRITEAPSVSYRLTLMVDTAPETVRRVIENAWSIDAPDLKNGEPYGDLPVYGKTGYPVSPYRMMSEAYEGLWESAYVGMIPQTPKDFASAKDQVCGDMNPPQVGRNAYGVYEAPTPPN